MAPQRNRNRTRVPNTSLRSDAFGGTIGKMCAQATGYFHTEIIDNAWWFCTPLGNAYASRGIYFAAYVNSNDEFGNNNYQAIMAKYGSTANWARFTNARLASWGFNSLRGAIAENLWPYQTDRSYPVDANGLQSMPNKLSFEPVFYPMRNAMKNLLQGEYGAVYSTYLTEPTKSIFAGKSPYLKGWSPWTAGGDMYDPGIYTFLATDLARGRIANLIRNSPYKNWVLGVAVDEGDTLYGIQVGPDFASVPPGHNNVNLAWAVATGSPVQSALTGFHVLYNNQILHSKAAWADYLKVKYGTIAALNAAWGSSYSACSTLRPTADGFGSCATPRTGEVVATGDGVSTIFRHNVANLTPTKFSLQVLVNGKVVGGDTGDGNIWGPHLTASTINYSTGAMSLTFTTGSNTGIQSIAGNGTTITVKTASKDPTIPGQHGYWVGGRVTISGTSKFNVTNARVLSIIDPYTFTIAGTATGSEAPINTGSVSFADAAPAAGAVITIKYMQNGWGIGNGLLDEDARPTHPWMGNDSVYLSNTAAPTASDLSDFFRQMVEYYFSNVHNQLAADPVFKNFLYLGPDTLSSWSAPPPKEVLQAASKYVDVLLAGGQQAFTAPMLGFIETYFGNKPLITAIYLTANADSSFFNWAETQATAQPTQNSKGSSYYSSVMEMVSARYPVSGTRPYVGSAMWSYLDMWNEKLNWGLVSWLDNAYDGKEAVATKGPCSPPLEQFTCGGEPSYPVWAPNTAYATGSYPMQKQNRILVQAGGSYYVFACVVAGTSGSTPPQWPTTVGATVRDGSVTWKNLAAKPNPSAFGDNVSIVKSGNALWK
ncbi:MAG: hypothetical protein ACE14L_05875 [Terriglobales bacterium]